MNPDFTNKVVLVTGASVGIGESIALLFAQLGAKLALVGRNAENLRGVAARCEAERGLPPLAIVADLATDAGVQATADETIQHFGRLNVLVNNAAIGARTLFLQEADMAVYDRVFNTNIRSLYYLTSLLVPELVQTKGNVVNISSITGTMVGVGSLPYSMSKAALDHFSRIIALELAPKGVRVNTVSPGITVSKIVQRCTGATEEQYQEWLEEMGGVIPMQRVCTGLDVARAVVHLASEHSALVTGALLTVDGGLRFVGMNQRLNKPKIPIEPLYK